MARALRLVGIVISASFAALLAYGGYIVVMMVAFDTEPYAHWSGERTFTCQLDRSPTHPKLRVVFWENERRAVIRFPGREITTMFQRGGFGGDHFRGGGIKLFIDPDAKAYVTGYGDESIGPCRLDERASASG